MTVAPEMPSGVAGVAVEVWSLLEPRALLIWSDTHWTLEMEPVWRFGMPSDKSSPMAAAHFKCDGAGERLRCSGRRDLGHRP